MFQLNIATQGNGGNAISSDDLENKHKKIELVVVNKSFFKVDKSI